MVNIIPPKKLLTEPLKAMPLQTLAYKNMNSDWHNV
jgi:hypothetical protein